MRLKVLTYNVHSCFGMDRLYDPSRIRDVLLEVDADVVALQEIDSSLEVSDGVDQLRFLSESTGMHAVIGPTLKRAYGSYGNAFLSKMELREVFEADLTYRRFEPRGLLKAEIEFRGGRVRVINTHLGLKYWERKFQVRRVLEAVDWSPTHPTVLMGDFNEWFPWSPNVRRLARHFGPTPYAKTFPSRWPSFSLDRVFVHPRPRHFQFSVIDSNAARVASDHLPVLAEITF